MYLRHILVLSVLLFSLNSTQAQEWITDFETAKVTAQQDDKHIILVFQGSDWCAPCIKLDKHVWSTDYFKTYALNHYVMLKADFPRRKKNQLSQEQTEANKKLAELYNQQGYFPFVVVLNAEGKVLGELGYQNISPQDYVSEINAFIL